MAVSALPFIVEAKHRTNTTDLTGLNHGPDRVDSVPGRNRIALGLAGLAILAATAAGCAPFDVNVTTAEPLKVDLSMEVHVYQHGEPDEAENETRRTYKETMNRRRDRMAEIQELKNNRLVGETHEGTLEIRSLPAGEYGSYVRETVNAENEDRLFLMEHEAEEKSSPLAEVQRLQWRHWQRKSFPGEWIEVEGDEAGSFRWIQKQGASESEGGEAASESAEPSE